MFVIKKKLTKIMHTNVYIVPIHLSMMIGLIKINFSGTSVVLGDSQNPLRVILLPNPSHLEAANPVKINHHFLYL
jgi:hypothetical protein